MSTHEFIQIIESSPAITSSPLSHCYRSCKYGKKNKMKARVSVTFTFFHDTEKRKTSSDHYRRQEINTDDTSENWRLKCAHTARPAASMQALKATCTMTLSDDI